MKKAILCGAVLAAVSLLSGCGDAGSDKQPKLSGTPDPKIQGPAAAGQGAAPGGAAPVKPGVN